MTKDEVEKVLDRVRKLPRKEQEKVARFVREVERSRTGHNLTDVEWNIIRTRAARRDFATDEEMEELFDRYRSA